MSDQDQAKEAKYVVMAGLAVLTAPVWLPVCFALWFVASAMTFVAMCSCHVMVFIGGVTVLVGFKKTGRKIMDRFGFYAKACSDLFDVIC